MRYLLLMIGGLHDDAPTAGATGDEATAGQAAAGAGDEPCWAPWDEQLRAMGITHDGAQLEPVGTARTVRRRRGEVLVADGPFAETKEYIAGYEVIECPDLDTALRAAAGHPIASFGAVEVRPIHED